MKTRTITIKEAADERLNGRLEASIDGKTWFNVSYDSYCFAWKWPGENYIEADPRLAFRVVEPECAANARLIAAAPDLLAACEDVLPDLLYGTSNPYASAQQRARYESLKSAVAKAKGEVKP